MAFEPVMRMALTGRYERITAARAYQLGMVSQVVDPPEQLRDAAQALAEKIARNSPAAMRATKTRALGRAGAGPHRGVPHGARQMLSMWGHPDQAEGPAAFAEKRSAAGGAGWNSMTFRPTTP